MNALNKCLMACDDIKSQATRLEDHIDDLTGGQFVDVGAELKRAIDTLEKVSKVIKARIADNATDGKLQGAHFKATVSETVRWTLNSELIKEEMGLEWVNAHSKQSVSRMVRYGI